MLRKVSLFALTVAVALVTVNAIAPPAEAQTQLLVCAADTHLARKGDYMNGTTSMLDVGVWEWEIGSGDTYTNIQCITADGMLYASATLRDPIYALSTFATADLAVSRYLGNTTRPFASEVDFLMNVCAFDESEYLEGNGAYCVKAQELYWRVVSEYSAIENVDRHIAPRASLAGWDVALHIRAAWRAGFESYARAMVNRILERRPDWEHVLYAGLYDYTEVSWGNLLRVIVEMYRAGDLSTAAYTEGLEFADELIATNGPDGSWGDGDYQTTAYAVLGFRADPWNWSTPWHQAWVRGVNFLEDALALSSPNCGFSYPPEYGEINSEGIMAISVSYTLPFFDGFESGDTNAWSGSVGHQPFAPQPERRSGSGRPPIELFR